MGGGYVGQAAVEHVLHEVHHHAPAGVGRIRDPGGIQVEVSHDQRGPGGCRGSPDLLLQFLQLQLLHGEAAVFAGMTVVEETPLAVDAADEEGPAGGELQFQPNGLDVVVFHQVQAQCWIHCHGQSVTDKDNDSGGSPGGREEDAVGGDGKAGSVCQLGLCDDGYIDAAAGEEVDQAELLGPSEVTRVPRDYAEALVDTRYW